MGLRLSQTGLPVRRRLAWTALRQRDHRQRRVSTWHAALACRRRRAVYPWLRRPARLLRWSGGRYADWLGCGRVLGLGRSGRRTVAAQRDTCHTGAPVAARTV